MNPRKNDFERAVSLLHRDGYTCVLCDRDRVLTSREQEGTRVSLNFKVASGGEYGTQHSAGRG